MPVRDLTPEEDAAIEAHWQEMEREVADFLEQRGGLRGLELDRVTDTIVTATQTALFEGITEFTAGMILPEPPKVLH